MANPNRITKPHRRPQPAKPAVRWEDYHDYLAKPKSVLAQRRLLRRALLEMDDEAVGLCYSLVIYSAMQSQMRADAAELARIKASGIYIRGAKLVPASELRPIPQKRKAHAGKAVRS